MILFLVLSLIFSQSPAPSTSVDEKSQQIINRAIETLGGQKYLDVQTVMGKGFYTTFKDGISQIPARFLDHIAYHDRERTEFSGAGMRTMQTSTGETGWMVEGAVKKMSDQTRTQVADFKQAIRTSLEYLLR